MITLLVGFWVTAVVLVAALVAVSMYLDHRAWRAAGAEVVEEAEALLRQASEGMIHG